MRLVLVEDYLPLHQGLAVALRAEGWVVDSAYCLADARRLLRGEVPPGVIVLDRGLPDGDGLELLADLHHWKMDVPVLVLTSRDAIDDRVAGLDAGAADYLIKPVAIVELLARLRSLVRRHRGLGSSRVSLGDVVLDTSARTVERGGIHLELTTKEYLILEHLFLHGGAVVSRRELWDHLYDDQSETISNVLDVLVSRVRAKLGAPPVIHTCRGQGYIATTAYA